LRTHVFGCLELEVAPIFVTKKHPSSKNFYGNFFIKFWKISRESNAEISEKKTLRREIFEPFILGTFGKFHEKVIQNYMKKTHLLEKFFSHLFWQLSGNKWLKNF
jgi:hypothetical protein